MGVIVEFFTDEKLIVDLCARYWALDETGRFVYRVSDLVLPPGATARRVTAFVKEHCRAYDPDIVCQGCGRPYVFFANRSEYQQRSGWPVRRPCDECRRADLEREQAARQAAVEAKRLRIRQHFDAGKREPLITCDELSFEEAIGLLALFRLAAPEGLGVISPVGEVDGLLAPTVELATDLLVMLYRNGRISVDPESQISAFTDDGQRFYPFSVAWLPPVGDDGYPAGVLGSLESVFRGGAWPEEWSSQSLQFWCEVARHECLQYMKVCMDEHGLEFKAGDKTQQVLDGVLEDYSPAQAYNLIWRATKDAAAYFMRSNVSRKQAANSIIGSIQRLAERGLTEGWDVKPYRRDRRAPESMVSHVLYRVALGLRGEGIEHVPREISPSDIGRGELSASDDVNPEVAIAGPGARLPAVHPGVSVLWLGYRTDVSPLRYRAGS